MQIITILRLSIICIKVQLKIDYFYVSVNIYEFNKSFVIY